MKKIQDKANILFQLVFRVPVSSNFWINNLVTSLKLNRWKKFLSSKWIHKTFLSETTTYPLAQYWSHIAHEYCVIAYSPTDHFRCNIF